MPQNLRDIRRKIRTVQSIEKITRAMKMVAVAKLRRLQASVENGRDYWVALDEMIKSVGAQAGELNHALLSPNNSENRAVVVIGGARGLCGSFNVILLRKAQDHLHSINEPLHLTTVGGKAKQFFERQKISIHDTRHTPDEAHRLLVARDISRILQEMYLRGEVGQVDFVYTEFRSAIRQIPKVRQFLPIQPVEDANNNNDHAAAIFEPEAQELLDTLLPRALDAMVYEMLLQSATSEEGARMAAMSAATENAGELKTNMTRDLNRARQSLITGEILEIVSGANALLDA